MYSNEKQKIMQEFKNNESNSQLSQLLPLTVEYHDPKKLVTHGYLLVDQRQVLTGGRSVWYIGCAGVNRDSKIYRAARTDVLRSKPTK